jgi:hypothetical protein
MSVSVRGQLDVTRLQSQPWKHIKTRVAFQLQLHVRCKTLGKVNNYTHIKYQAYSQLLKQVRKL